MSSLGRGRASCPWEKGTRNGRRGVSVAGACNLTILYTLVFETGSSHKARKIIDICSRPRARHARGWGGQSGGRRARCPVLGLRALSLLGLEQHDRVLAACAGLRDAAAHRAHEARGGLVVGLAVPGCDISPNPHLGLGLG